MAQSIPEEMKPLLEVFRAYNSFGRKGDQDHMDCRTFSKLCRENNLLVPPVRPTDSDLIFSMVIPTPSTKQINFNLFVKALDKLAERADGNLGTTKVLIETIVKNGGPKSSGTVAEATRFHDDKSNYTGMHRNRAGNVEGAAEAQPQPTNAPSTLQTQALLQRRASLRANIDKNKEVDLEEIFTTYCNIGKRRDQTYKILDSRGFQHLLRDSGVIGKHFTTVDSDLVFSSVLVPGDKTCTFSQFTSALDKVVARTNKSVGSLEDLTAKIISTYRANGGPILIGTQTEYTRWHDDKTTYTGAHAERHGVATLERRPSQSKAMLDKNGSGSLTDAIATASISPKAVTSPKGAPTKGPSSASMNAPAAKTASLRGLAKASSFLQRAEAAKKPVPAEFAAIKPVFEKYNSFGAKKDTQNMDGRTFAKFCKDMKLLKKPMLPTDCDLVFAEVLTTPGQKKIEFREFMHALEKLCERAKGKLGDMNELVTNILTQYEMTGGPSSSGTVAQANKFHDDKNLYTGVYKHGGPSTVDTGTSDLKFVTNRAPADVRGVNHV